jgi:hypothetical protein
MEYGLHRPSAWDFPLSPLGECYCEANPQEAARWARSARGFGLPATPLGHLVNDLYTLPPHVKYTPG